MPKIIKKQPVGQELATGFNKIHDFLCTALKRSGKFVSSSEDDKQDEIHNQAIERLNARTLDMLESHFGGNEEKMMEFIQFSMSHTIKMLD